MSPADTKDTVDDARRRGLEGMTATPTKPRPVFQTQSVDLGRPRLANIDNTSEVLAVIEGENFR